MSTVAQMPISSLDMSYRELRLMRPELLGALRRSMARHGLLHPVVANVFGDGRVVVLDGFKRIEVLQEQSVETVAVQQVHLTEEEAQAAILTYNAPHRGLCELEEAWIVHRLHRRHGMKQARIGALVGRHKSWVCRRLALAERLAHSVQDDMRLGLVSAAVARELVRLPRGNQAQVAAAVREHGLASRQVGALVKLWLCSEAESREALLSDPCRYIGVRTRRAPRSMHDPRLSAEAEAVRQSLLRLEAAASDFGRAAQRHPPQALNEEQLSLMTPTMRRARRELLAALRELEQLFWDWDEQGGQLQDDEQQRERCP